MELLYKVLMLAIAVVLGGVGMAMVMAIASELRCKRTKKASRPLQTHYDNEVYAPLFYPNEPPSRDAGVERD